MTTNGPVQRLSTPVRIDRRAALGRLLALTLLAPPAEGVLIGCARHGDQSGMGDGGGMPGWMMSGGDMDAMMADMPAIHDLLVRHDAVRRQVDDIEGGIRARTTSDDSSVAQLIQTHVQQMKGRIETGRPIRQMDPLFREIFEHYRAIAMTVSQIPGGVEVTETSPDPRVALLIRQHAHHAVSEFVARGMDAPCNPPRYQPATATSPEHLQRDGVDGVLLTWSARR